MKMILLTGFKLCKIKYTICYFKELDFYFIHYRNIHHSFRKCVFIIYNIGKQNNDFYKYNLVRKFFKNNNRKKNFELLKLN